MCSSLPFTVFFCAYLLHLWGSHYLTAGLQVYLSNFLGSQLPLDVICKTFEFLLLSKDFFC